MTKLRIIHGGKGLSSSGNGPYDPGMEARVAKLEQDISEIRDSMKTIVPKIVEMHAFMTAKLPHLATKEDLAEKPSKTYLWMILAVLIAAILGAGAIGVTLK